MQKLSKSALKAKMLEYLRRVEETGEELIVTDNNVPVIRITRFGRAGPPMRCLPTCTAGWSITKTS